MSAFLLGDFIFIAAWAVLFIFSPKTRRVQLFGSLLLIPFGFLDFFFRPDYWNPPLLIKAIEPFSVETAIYCFGAGGIAAVVGSCFVKSGKSLRLDWFKVISFLIIAFALFAILKIATSLNAMNLLNFSFLLIWIVVLAQKFVRFWRSIGSGLLLALFTVVAVNIGLLFFPGFVARYWNVSQNWPLFLNTPTEEIFFAGILGSLWALLPASLLRD